MGQITNKNRYVTHGVRIQMEKKNEEQEEDEDPPQQKNI